MLLLGIIDGLLNGNFDFLLVLKRGTLIFGLSVIFALNDGLLNFDDGLLNFDDDFFNFNDDFFNFNDGVCFSIITGSILRFNLLLISYNLLTGIVIGIGDGNKARLISIYPLSISALIGSISLSISFVFDLISGSTSGSISISISGSILIDSELSLISFVFAVFSFFDSSISNISFFSSSISIFKYVSS